MTDITVGFLAVGDKGFNTIRDLDGRPGIVLHRVQTYDQANASRYSVDDFVQLGASVGAKVSVGRNVDVGLFDDCDLVFAVGWQFMIASPPPNLAILHDSLLRRIAASRRR